MKKIIVLAALLFTFNVATHAQGNLQFNQVLTYTGSINGMTNQWTVPAGKVWKIESKTRTPNGGLTFYINSTAVNDYYFFWNNAGQASVSSMAIDSAPIWLKAGDISYFNSSGTANYYISIIEFNIVP